MKLMIASDIHGSAFYCRKLIEAFKSSSAKKLLLLGDILYHGPRNNLPREYDPKQVISMLNSISGDILCVRGNCDSEVDQMVLDFNIMADYAVIYDNDRMIFATHGHIYNKENAPKLTDGDIFLYGHTHIPVCQTIGKITYMNPGSVSIPKEDSWHGYMILDDGKFTWYDFDGLEHISF